MNTNLLSLPQLTASFSSPHADFSKACLLALGGRPPEAGWLSTAAKGRPVWAVDRGLAACREADVLPMRIIGDGDSAPQELWVWGEKLGVPVDRFPPEKDLTDTQLALQLTHESGFSAALLTGAFGGRFDHAFSTAFSAAHAPIPCLLADEREAMLFLRDGERVSILCQAEPLAVSLLPISERVTGVCAENLRWPLQDATLTQYAPTTVSNVLSKEADTFSIAIARGILAIYFCWAE